MITINIDEDFIDYKNQSDITNWYITAHSRASLSVENIFLNVYWYIE